MEGDDLTVGLCSVLDRKEVAIDPFCARATKGSRSGTHVGVRATDTAICVEV